MHRFKEGARVLEDVARFVLQDDALFQKIKAMKHQVQVPDTFRDRPIADDDIGGPAFKEGVVRPDLIALLKANAARMQESARVLEEVFDRDTFKQLRFESYDLAEKMLLRVKQYLHQDSLQGLYPVCDPNIHDLEEIISKINASDDIKLCQLHMKHASARAVYEAAKMMREKVKPNTLLILSDHVDIALLCADGVHVDQENMPVEAIRQLSNASFIIGVSCHTVEEALSAQNNGASYLSAGAIPSSTREAKGAPVSNTVLNAMKQSIRIPICGIGGMMQDTKDEREAHADMFLTCATYF